ncbi:MAG: shikimate kinase [Saprospiraceae bacterium]
MKIYLLGFMGSGKSFLGQRLGKGLNIPFADLDDLIEENAGMSISTIFETGGEPVFRQIEQKSLHATATWDEAIISTGGGAPCFFDNMDWMNLHGLTIYLETAPSLLAQRLQKEMAHRPLLAQLNPDELQAFIHQKIAERAAFYQKAKLIWKQDQKNEADWPILMQKIQALLSGSSKNL